MSTHDEKLRAIINCREFLHNLLDPKKTPRVPKVVRQTAHRVCRHLPFPCELEDLFEDKIHADRDNDINSRVMLYRITRTHKEGAD